MKTPDLLSYFKNPRSKKAFLDPRGTVPGFELQFFYPKSFFADEEPFITALIVLILLERNLQNGKVGIVKKFVAVKIDLSVHM